MKKHISVRLEEELINSFKEQCKRDELSQSEVIRMLLELYASGKLEVQKGTPIAKLKE